ncbi:MAG TPA: M28 family peptidase [Cytophagaceae bacterium]|nr:M28 family peptidase [Cytophagaceae bacterium]
MRNFLIATLLLIAIVPLQAQQDLSVVEKYASSINAEDAKRHLTILASDWMAGRETGEQGQKMAAAYIADQFKHFSLKPVVKEGNEYSYYQKFDLEKRAWKEVYLSVGGQKKKFLEDFYLYGDFDVPTEEKSELVFAGYGIDAPNYSDYKNAHGKSLMDIQGKTVIIFPGEPFKDSVSYVTKSKATSVWANDWRKKASTARDLGAKHVIVIVGKTDSDFKSRLNMLKPHLEQPTLCFTHKERTSSAIFVPVSLAAQLLGKTTEELIQLRDERAEAMAAHKSFKKTIMPLDFALKVEVSKTRISTENILGLIEGTDKKDEIVVLTAHYDHIGKEGNKIYYGADDDGSGTTALLELAEAFSMAAREGYKPKRSILIMPVTAEEKGLMGSEYYTDKPVFPLSKTVADLNIDMIGRLDSVHANNPDYVYIIGSNRLSTQLHQISEQANKNSVNIQLDYRFNSFDDPNRFYFRSDHYNFAKNNIPVIFYFNGVHADYHKPTDTVDKINFEKLTKITKLVFYTAWDLANREDRIVVDVHE